MTAPRTPGVVPATLGPAPAALLRVRWRAVAVAVAGVAVVLGLLVASPLLVIGPPVAGLATRHRLAVAGRRRHHRELAAQVPVYVDELIQRLKAGSSLAAAVRELPTAGGHPPRSALDDALDPLRRRLVAGSRLGPALAAASDGAAPGVDLLLSTLRVLVIRGGPALPSLERLSDTLRTARSLEEEIRAQAGQATASAAALTGLPMLFVVVMALADRRLAAFYLHHPVGSACLVTAAGLVHLGWWWMDHLMGGS